MNRLRYLFVLLLMSCCQVAAQSNVSIKPVDSSIEISYEGILQHSSDLENWTSYNPQPLSPFIEPSERGKYYRTLDPAAIIQVPIIAFTGQSNTGGISNVDPNGEFGDILVHHTWTVSDGNSGFNPNLNPQHFQSVSPGALGRTGFGSSFHFIRELLLSEYHSGRSDHLRFATSLSAGGGQPASLWNPNFFNQTQYTAFDHAIRDKIAILNAQYPEANFFLHTVIINQGEREAATGVNWSTSWTAFIDRIRRDFGDVDFYVELISTNGLMSFPEVPSGLAENGNNLELLRERQEGMLEGSGSEYERERVYGVETNVLLENNGGTNEGLTDGGVHYSREGYRLLGLETLKRFQQVQELPR